MIGLVCICGEKQIAKQFALRGRNGGAKLGEMRGVSHAKRTWQWKREREIAPVEPVQQRRTFPRARPGKGRRWRFAP
jgi:hypothetical protein